ncbi:hypothetical protein TL16_g05498 [Triparma laevis f. inornata]|uniref:Uncharacterized protein n=1 Tax=Triparma laevis f. inornata TaxID=1714386 RepID=A0A9W7E750_9STRA|nr:hypothetical protein TL16_g05498 [Triparma laevis f. inornata]
MNDFYAAPLERSYLEEDTTMTNLIEDNMELTFMEEEWEECSLADSEVSFEMIDEELPEGTPKSFKDVLLSGLIEGQFVNDLPKTASPNPWGSPPAPPAVVSQPSSFNSVGELGLRADAELIWEDSKSRGAKNKQRDAVRKSKDKEKKDQQNLQGSCRKR